MLIRVRHNHTSSANSFVRDPGRGGVVRLIRAFTLIELLLVIAIITIPAALTAQPINQPPTNMLANVSTGIPLASGSARNPFSAPSYFEASRNDIVGIDNSNYAITENSDATFSPLPTDSEWSLSLISASALNGTATISDDQLQIFYTPNFGFTGPDTISYAYQDNLGDTGSSSLTVLVTNIPPLANPVSYTVWQCSVNNAFDPLTNDVVETPGGTLGLVPGSADLTSGSGNAYTRGDNVIFMPAYGYLGTATISYQVTDGVGGTSSSCITVTVAPNMVAAQLLSGGTIVVSWNNSAFVLQSASKVDGPYNDVLDDSGVNFVASPYTNVIGTNALGFFQLRYQPPGD